ncbi:MAG TPA: hypothetical protein VFE51_17670 [Verrucomicrobiae bacterium]|nr:hypothetical protein [Verrucomicrobiae bacterium]
MKTAQFMNQAQIFIEAGQELLRALNGSQTLEVRLERLADGRLTDTCKTELTTRLQKFIDHKAWQPRARVHFAIGARGVSLRRLTMPTGSKDEVQRMLPLQIEREFPLSPDQLAWGAQALNGGRAGPNHSNGKQEFLVAAVKKDLLEEYAAILDNCGALPVFTLAALDRTYVCPQPPGSYAVLDVGGSYSELILMEVGFPTAVRVLPWGREHWSRAPHPPRTPSPEAVSQAHGVASFGGNVPPAPSEAPSPVQELVELIKGQSIGRALYVTGLGGLVTQSDFTTELTGRIGKGIECRVVDEPGDAAGSSAVLGLQRALASPVGTPPLVLQLKQAKGTTRMPPREQLKWAGLAAGLLILGMVLPYAEALVLKPHLAHKLAAIKNDQRRLGVIDRELDFLQYLQANEPPYLDALLVLAKSAPPGTRFDSVSMNRRGEISLRGSLHDGQQVADLRAKLVDSGFFAAVSVDEQAPTPDRQKVNVRMTAQWKSPNERVNPPAEPASAPNEHKGSASPPPGAARPGMPAPRRADFPVRRDPQTESGETTSLGVSHSSAPIPANTGKN